MKKDDEIETIRPEIFDLIKLGDKFGGHSFKGMNREEIGIKLREIFEESKRRLNK